MKNKHQETCPCNEYPLKPHFCIAKLGYTGVNLFFLFLLQNIDCRYSLEPPRRSMFWSKHKKNNKTVLLKIFNFNNLKNLCILHERVEKIANPLTSNNVYTSKNRLTV